MCGINLIIDTTASLDDAPIRKMNQRLRHRGPDQSGLHIEQHQGKTRFFGHTRLKVLDTSEQNQQPFHSPCGRYLLIFNGEIYNFKVLRQELMQKGIQFHTRGDTEVLLHLLIQYGEDALPKLEGMFAFCFWDKEADILLLARDRFGMKPLYYCEKGAYWLASSEIKAILASGLVEPELNSSQIAHYLQFRFARKPETFLRGVHELTEGMFLKVSGGETYLNSYVERTYPDEKAGEVDPGRMSELLIAAVERQLVSDVPVGLFLSGGVDSTLLLAITRELGRKGFPAFVMANAPEAGSFGTRDFLYAKKAAKLYEAELHEIPVQDQVLDHLDAYVQSLDQPIADGGGLLTFLLSNAVSKQATVALSGAGADELFGGYNRHLAFGRYVHHHNMWIRMRPLLWGSAALLPAGFDHPWRNRFRLVKKFIGALHPDPAETFRRFTAMAFDVKGGQSPQVWNPRFLLDEALHTDRHHYLVSDILMMTDQASMAHSLEVRMPYLDNAVLKEVEKLGAEKVLGQGQKWILKQLLVERGGKLFCERPKEGFGMPIGKWIRQPAHQHWVALLRNHQHPMYEWVNPTSTRHMLERHLKGKADFSAEITALLILMRWMDHNFAT